jgi:hypothetical protein
MRNENAGHPMGCLAARRGQLRSGTHRTPHLAMPGNYHLRKTDERKMRERCRVGSLMGRDSRHAPVGPAIVDLSHWADGS